MQFHVLVFDVYGVLGKMIKPELNELHVHVSQLYVVSSRATFKK